MTQDKWMADRNVLRCPQCRGTGQLEGPWGYGTVCLYCNGRALVCEGSHEPYDPPKRTSRSER